MILQVIREIEVNEEEIIKEYFLTMNTPFVDIIKAVHNYILGLDDCDFYAIHTEEEEKIAKKILDILWKNY